MPRDLHYFAECKLPGEDVGLRVFVIYHQVPDDKPAIPSVPTSCITEDCPNGGHHDLMLITRERYLELDADSDYGC